MIPATTVHHTYPSTDQSYWTAQCDTCQVVLNSGHHWNDRYFAAREARTHNDERHGLVVGFRLDAQGARDLADWIVSRDLFAVADAQDDDGHVGVGLVYVSKVAQDKVQRVVAQALSAGVPTVRRALRSATV